GSSTDARVAPSATGQKVSGPPSASSPTPVGVKKNDDRAETEKSTGLAGAFAEARQQNRTAPAPATSTNGAVAEKPVLLRGDSAHQMPGPTSSDANDVQN